MMQLQHSLDHLAQAAAETAARRELALVKAVGFPHARGALATAFAHHRRYLMTWLGLTDAQSDLYCMRRLQTLAADGLPAEAMFLQDVTDQLSTMTKGMT